MATEQVPGGIWGQELPQPVPPQFDSAPIRRNEIMRTRARTDTDLKAILTRLGGLNVPEAEIDRQAKDFAATFVPRYQRAIDAAFTALDELSQEETENGKLF